ncbi:hypothetical protein EJ03DRAFT_131114 [Teratosphaeria nubilosa]|uniref:Uncharacterized protein n=1 Tax=Teratosphaeria nubilosa TaxID=161662 RepID=A0A6G1LKJ6_9PEZI|nr:hypothetical protein EJ03DRAFT_131114 [Teratosphaeria nubilosa]
MHAPPHLPFPRDTLTADPLFKHIAHLAIATFLMSMSMQTSGSQGSSGDSPSTHAMSLEMLIAQLPTASHASLPGAHVVS